MKTTTTDDLVKRALAMPSSKLCCEMARRIEALEQAIKDAIECAEQLHYGCLDTAIDHYQEAIGKLRGVINND